jgi:hypothetical protein
MEGSCEHGNEPLGSIKCWQNLHVAEQLADSEEGLSFIKLLNKQVPQKWIKINTFLGNALVINPIVLTQQPTKCLTRDCAHTLKTEDVIVCCVVRTTSHSKGGGAK